MEFGVLHMLDLTVLQQEISSISHTVPNPLFRFHSPKSQDYKLKPASLKACYETKLSARQLMCNRGSIGANDGPTCSGAVAVELIVTEQR
jgi:hypothetical protein